MIGPYIVSFIAGGLAGFFFVKWRSARAHANFYLERVIALANQHDDDKMYLIHEEGGE